MGDNDIVCTVDGSTQVGGIVILNAQRTHSLSCRYGHVAMLSCDAVFEGQTVGASIYANISVEYADWIARHSDVEGLKCIGGEAVELVLPRVSFIPVEEKHIIFSRIFSEVIDHEPVGKELFEGDAQVWY